MKDRVPLYPGRVRLTPVSGQANTYDMIRADEPQEPGTPLNKANLLSDETAKKLGFAETEDPSVNDAFWLSLKNSHRYGFAMASYLALVGNVNQDMVNGALGKNNEEFVAGLGWSLSMYAWHLGASKTEHPFTELRKCDNFDEIFKSTAAYEEIVNCSELYNYLKANSYIGESFKNAVTGYNLAKAMGLNGIPLTEVYPTVFNDEALATAFFNNQNAMLSAFNDYTISTDYVRNSPYLSKAVESPYYAKTTVSEVLGDKDKRQTHYDGKCFVLSMSQSAGERSDFLSTVETLDGLKTVACTTTYDPDNNGTMWTLGYFANSAKCHPYHPNNYYNQTATGTSVMIYLKIA